jgi:3-isopropylmalate dehydrogenase
MRVKIAVLPGDGIGPEVTREALRVLRTVGEMSGFEIQLQEKPIGGAAVLEHGSPLPRTTLDACLDSDAIFLGAVGGPQFDSLPKEQRPETGLLQLRQALGCYANLRPAIAYSAIADCSPLRASVVKNADVLIIRELLGGLYFGEPRGMNANSAFNTMTYSESEVERIARVAFEQAGKRRQKVTSVDKANVLETSVLWRKTVSRVGREYPKIELEHLYVDAFAMHLITNPTRFDVVVTENLFGDILSDEAAVITGSIGMLASASIGGSVDLYEPIHGSAPDIAGKGLANPIGAIASIAMMLRHSFHMDQEASDVEASIRSVLEAGYKTADLARGKSTAVSTTEMGALIEQKVADILHGRQAYHAV